LRITGPQGRGESSNANEKDQRAVRGGWPITEEHRETMRSSAKSGSEKPRHRLRANQRRVHRSAGKAGTDGHAFAGYVRREESLEKPVTFELTTSLLPKKSTPTLIEVSLF
jgi:hypothetical protein